MITNNQEKLYRSLRSSKGRREHGLFVVEGRKVILELLKSDHEVEVIMTSSEEGFGPEIAVEHCPQRVIDRISSFKNPGAEIAIVRSKRTDPVLDLKGPVFLLENIQDPGNLGSMIRTLRWFGATQMVVSPDCVDTFNPKVIRSSMGAVFHVNAIKAPLADSITDLNEAGIEVYATEMDGDPALMKILNKNVGIVIGNEGHGISEEVKRRCNGSISIAGAGQPGVESLNAAISLGILAHQLFKNPENG